VAQLCHWSTSMDRRSC